MGTMRERQFSELTSAGVERTCPNCHYYGHDVSACEAGAVSPLVNDRYTQSDGSLDPATARRCTAFVTSPKIAYEAEDAQREAAFRTAIGVGLPEHFAEHEEAELALISQLEAPLGCTSIPELQGVEA